MENMNVQEAILNLCETPLYALLYTCSVLLSNGKNGLITHYTEISKLGQMLPISECLLRPILCICDMPEKRMRKEGLQYTNGKLAICEPQKKE